MVVSKVQFQPESSVDRAPHYRICLLRFLPSCYIFCYYSAYRPEKLKMKMPASREPLNFIVWNKLPRREYLMFEYLVHVIIYYCIQTFLLQTNFTMPRNRPSCT